MAFSQSFEMGNSTLQNLESQARRALNDPLNIEAKGECQNKPPSNPAPATIDVIEESPTKERTRGSTTMSAMGKSRTFRLHSHVSNVNSTADKQRRKFRRSKSDSTLPKPKPDFREESYEALFRSDFTFSIANNDKKSEDTNQQSTMWRVSQIEEVMAKIDNSTGDIGNESTLFDKPIFSEDLKDLLDSEKPLEDERLTADCWQDSLPMSIIPEAILDGVNEEVPALDATTFIGPADNAEAAELLAKQIQESRIEVHEVLQMENEVRNIQEIINESQMRSIKHSITSQKHNSTQLAGSSSSAPPKDFAIKDLESLKRVSAWNLPYSVLLEYEKKGVVKMFDWQIECLSNPKVLFEHCNLVYSAPTSAGKSLVSEILLLKTVLERSKKVLFILPFISVVREKMSYLQDLLTTAGYRAEGFFGGYTPPGGFESIHVAICTIEKANSIINKLLEQGKLSDIGALVVDEVHLISDPGRGYILELLLAKVLYMSRKYGLQIQIITMSATLANVELLKRWLDAELYITDFRPVTLQEMIKIGNKIYDTNMRQLRDVTQPLAGEDYSFPLLPNDSDHVAQLCLETLLEGCSVIVFCPSKDWCENLAVQLAGAIHSMGKMDDTWGTRLRAQIKREAINEVKEQLRNIPTGLDAVLEKTITYACAFHHAGLTSEERDIVEASFKSGALKIIVATSTLSSGVNLPARRVLIRTPLFGGKQMSSLTYRQMIGRAGRTGKDTMGESILICSDANGRIGRELITVDLQPINSCLEMDSSTHLKRALLEVISSGVACTKEDLENFVNCTLLSAQKQLEAQGKEDANHEISYISETLDFLKEYEFIRLQTNEETGEEIYVATRLGMACLASSMPPTDGLILFSELQRSRRCFVLESELHAVYLVTPYSVCYQLQDLDWLFFLDLWEKLSPAMKRVGELVGVKESFLVRAMRGQTKLDYKLMQIHKRFYTALALQELVNEVPINVVASKYKCSRGMLQSLQQMASTFAGIVTAFCNSLQWSTLSLIVSQFKERLYFGIHRDLIDLMRLPELSHKRARSFFDAGIVSLVELANADVLEVEKILYNSLSFDSNKQQDNENVYEAEKRNLERNFFIVGRPGVTADEAAKILVEEARKFVKHEIGVGHIKWSQTVDNAAKDISCETEKMPQLRKRKSEEAKESAEVTPPKINKTEVDKKEITPKVKRNDIRQSNESISGRRSNELECGTIIKEAKTLRKSPRISTANYKTQNTVNLYAKDKIEKLREEEKKTCKKKETSAPVQPDSGTKRYQLRRSTEQQKENIIKSSNTNEPTIIKPIPQTDDACKLTPKPPKTELVKCRRSPRFQNVLKEEKAQVNSSQLNTNHCIGASMFDESFELNSGIDVELNGACKAEADDAVWKLAHETSQISLNQSNDEVPNSQELHQATTSSSRLLRSTRMLAIDSPKKPFKDAHSSSVELSDLSVENSLIKDPIKLNTSHILSCSKVDTDASSFDCVEIVDICGNQELFKAAFDELKKAKRFGFSLGLQQQESKRKPLIGGNLLINQVKSNNAAIQSVSFQIDDCNYVAGCAFSAGANVVSYMNLQDENTCRGLTKDIKCKYLRMLFRDKENTILMHDAKEQLKVLQKHILGAGDIRANLEDPKVGSWLLQPEKTLSLQQMTQQFAPECTALVRLCGSGRGYSSFGLDSSSAIFAKMRCSVEACVTVHVLKGIIENLEGIGTGQLYKFFKELEMPLQLSLSSMEVFGFPASEQALRKLFQQMVDTMKKMECKIYEMHGSRFNLGSSTAVAKVLGLHRKANKRVSTARQILEKIGSPVAQLIIMYRKISTTLSKNIQPLLKCVQNNRIHGQSITYTLTGRISMTEPNLQMVTKDYEVHFGGSEKTTISCRSAFYPTDPGRCLLSSDFCQLEMRILAHLSQDAALLQVMNTEKDIFCAIAARWNKISESDVSEQLRNGTKQICYGIVYGMGMRSLAEALKCTEQEAKLLSEQFHSAYPGIRAYTDKVVKFARNNGYIETITGRRRYLENINNSEPHLKSQAERQAINSTIQGSAADIAKSAILRMEKNIEKYHNKLGIDVNAVRLVLHVHDELVFEVPEEKAKKVAKVLSLTMENCVKLSVLLRVKLKVGKSWGELKEIKL